MIPVLILLALNILGLGINVGKDGEKKSDQEYCSFSYFGYMAILWSLYYWAGLFDVFM